MSTSTVASAERRYRVLGTTDDAPVAGCEHCGRADLRTYVALEPTEGGPVVYFGTTCAARAEGLPVAAVRAEATAADRAAHEAAQAALRARRADEAAAYSTWLMARFGVAQPADLWALGLRPLSVLGEYRATL